MQNTGKEASTKAPAQKKVVAAKPQKLPPPGSYNVPKPKVLPPPPDANVQQKRAPRADTIRANNRTTEMLSAGKSYASEFGGGTTHMDRGAQQLIAKQPGYLTPQKKATYQKYTTAALQRTQNTPTKYGLFDKPMRDYATTKQGLSLASAGVPLSDTALGILGTAYHALGGSAKNVAISAGIPDNSHSISPGQLAAMNRVSIQRGFGPIPKGATDLQAIDHAFSGADKPSWTDAITNLPKDFAMTPAYAAVGALAFGKDLVKQSEKSPLGGLMAVKDFAAGQLPIIEHPGAFVEKHPFQTLQLIHGGLGAVGGGAGRLAGVAETARDVPMSYYDNVPLDRGLYSQNLYHRGLQKASDVALRNSQFLQNKRLKGLTHGPVQTAVREARHVGEAAVHPVVQSYLDAAQKLSPARRERLYENELAGTTPEATAAHFKSVNEQKGATPARNARIRRAEIQAKQPNALSTNDKAFLEAGRNLANHMTEAKTNIGILGDTAAKYREHQVPIEQAAARGDPLANTILHERNVSHELQKIDPALATEASQKYATAVDEFAQRHAANIGAPAVRVPMYKVEPKLQKAGRGSFSGGTIKGHQNPRYHLPGSNKFSTGSQLEEAAYAQHHTDLAHEALRTQHFASAIQFIKSIRESPLVKIQPENPGPGWVPHFTDNLGATPKLVMDAAGHLDEKTTAESLGKAWEGSRATENFNAGHQAGGREVMWVPAPMDHAIQKMVDSEKTPQNLMAFRRASNVVKQTILYTNAGHLGMQNLGNMAFGLMEGVGPANYARALAGRGHLPGERMEAVPGVEGTGFAAQNLSKVPGSLMQSVGEARNPANTLGETAKAVGGVGISPVRALLKFNRDFATGIDNFTRRAAHDRLLRKAAKRTVYGESSVAGRLKTMVNANSKRIDEVAAAIKSGDHPQAERLMRQINRDLIKNQGNFETLKRHPLVDIAMPFWRWAAFAASFMLRQPFEHPLKSALVYRLGALGRQVSARQGILSPSLATSFPVAQIPGLGTLSYNTSSVLPWNELQQLAGPNARGVPQPGQIIGNLSPAYKTLVEGLTGRDPSTGRILTTGGGFGIGTSDSTTPQSQSPADYGWLIANQLANTIPFLRALQPQHPSDTSVPIVHSEQSTAAMKSLTPAQPGWLPFANLLSPGHLSVNDLPALQKQAVQSTIKQEQTEYSKKQLDKAIPYAKQFMQQYGLGALNKSNPAYGRALAYGERMVRIHGG